MKISPGMMLDFFKLGHGLVVEITDRYESSLESKALDSDPSPMLTNRYECDVLVEGKMFSMSIIIHYNLRTKTWRDTEMYRMEWRVIGRSLFSRSGLAEVLWHAGKVL